MRKNTFLSVALLAASVSVVNAQEAPKELFWQNGSNTGIWSIMDRRKMESWSIIVCPIRWKEIAVLLVMSGESTKLIIFFIYKATIV